MSNFTPEFGTTADGLLAARIDETGYIAVPCDDGIRLASVLRLTRPIAEWTLANVFGSDGVVADEAAFRAHVAQVTVHLRQRAALGRKAGGSGVATPWGASQSATIYADGVVFHSTASHGGFRLDAVRNAQMPPSLRLPGGWYEEDEQWSRVALGFPDLFTDREKAAADRTLRNWDPDAWEAFHGRALTPEESHVRDRERFEREHAGDWVVISAIRSERHPGFVETTAAIGGHRGRGGERGFLVPAAEYTMGRPGFVIDPARHRTIA